MRNSLSTAAALALALVLGACASSPTTTSQLESTRSDFRVLQSTPNVATLAPNEFRQASDAMLAADQAANSREAIGRVDQLAYLAQQKIALTQEVVKTKQAQADVAAAAVARDQIRLAQRTAEADRATAAAQASQAAASAAQAQAQQAQAQAQMAQAQTEQARQQAADAQARASQLQAQLSELAAKQTERGLVVTLGDVLFAVDQATLNPNGMRTAQKLADVLRENPRRSVLVEGFTDSTGSSSYNQDLSLRRAMAVRDALVRMGVGPERVQVQGYGESYPVAPNDTAGNRQLNRRVEIVLSEEGATIRKR